jgi:uncharacterized membrane protein
MWKSVLTLLSLVGSGLVAGGIVAVAMAVVPAEGTLPAREYAQWHTPFAHHMDRYIPVVAVATILIGIGLAFLHTGWRERGLVLAGALLIVSIAVISETGNVPMNREIAAWGPETPLAETQRVRERWRRLHVYRTVAALLSQAAFAAAATFAARNHSGVEQPRRSS